MNFSIEKYSICCELLIHIVALIHAIGVATYCIEDSDRCFV